MQVKKYIARDMKEGLELIKKELGADAMVLATRELNGESFLSPSRIEITAALSATQLATSTKIETKTSDIKNAPETARGHDNAQTLLNDDIELRLESLRQELRVLRRAVRTDDREQETQSLKFDIDNLRRLIFERSGTQNDNQDLLRSVLEIADIEPSFAQRLTLQTKKINPDASVVTLVNPKIQAELLSRVISEQLQTFVSDHKRKRAIALVGPTGVGKTTTIAKLAAQATLLKRQKVVLVTTDTYRMGAVEQLGHYAELLDAPFYAVSTNQELQKVLASHARADRIYIDTAGRSFSDTEQIPILKEMLFKQSIEVHLTLAAATRAIELSRILDRFLPLTPDALLFTKLDETCVLGSILNATMKSQLPVSFVTFGQRVPEDISVAHNDLLARQFVQGAFEMAGLESKLGQSDTLDQLKVKTENEALLWN